MPHTNSEVKRALVVTLRLGPVAAARLVTMAQRLERPLGDIASLELTKQLTQDQRDGAPVANLA